MTTLKVETYSNPQHLSEPEGDPPPGHTWESAERGVEIDDGRVTAVVVWEAVEDPNRVPESRESPFTMDGYDPADDPFAGGFTEPRESLTTDTIDELSEERDELEQAYDGARAKLQSTLREITTLLSDVFDVDAADATLDEALRELGDQVEQLRGERDDLEDQYESTCDNLHQLQSVFVEIANTIGVNPAGREAKRTATRVRGKIKSIRSTLDNIAGACGKYLDYEGGLKYENLDDVVAEAIQNLENQRDTAIEALTGPPEDEGGDEPDTEGLDDQSIKACIDDVPVDRYTWQPASDLAERLDTTPQVIGMTAARYEEGQDTKWPIERRQTTSGKEYRIEPGESPFSGHFVYLIGPEVPDGMTPEQTCESEAEAKKEAASHKTEKDPDDYKPPVVRTEGGDIPEFGETLTWDEIEGDEGMEVVQ